MTNRFERLLNPRGIAIVGASAELDANPLLVHPTGLGVFAADALVVLR